MKMLGLAILLTLGLVTSAVAQTPPDIYYNTFEFSDMRSINPAGMTRLINGEQASPPANGGVCFGGIGSGVCTGLTCNEDNASVDCTVDTAHLRRVNDPANCHNGSQWCIRADLPGGSLGTNLTYQSGYTAGSIPQGCSTNGPTANCFTRHWFYRYWIKWAANFQLVQANPPNACQGKLLYMTSGNTSPLEVNIIYFQVLAGQTPNTLLLSIGTDFGNSNAFLALADNNWHSIEVEFFVGHYLSLWYDDVLEVNQFPNTQAQPQSAVDINRWGMYINQNWLNNVVGGTPLDQCRVVNTTSFWIDDLAVSTQRIGGSGAPPTAPNAPTNLRLISWLHRLWAWLVVGPRYA